MARNPATDKPPDKPIDRPAADRPINPVALLAALIGVAALLPFLGANWLLFKPNRLPINAESFGSFTVSTPWTVALLALWLAVGVVAFIPWRHRAWLLAGLATLGLAGSLLFLGEGARTLMADATASARVSPAGGVWLSFLAYYVALFAALNEAPDSRVGKVLMILAGPAVALIILATGGLAQLGLVLELTSIGGGFNARLREHLALAGTSVLLAALIGLPAAIAAARQDRVAGVVLPTAGLLQTLPSLALFGFMLAPLAQLGRSVTVGTALLFALGSLAVAVLLRLLALRLKPVNLRNTLVVLTVIVVLPGAALLTVMAAAVVYGWLIALFTLNPAGFAVRAGLGNPLSALGIRGIGTAPALIALTLYAFLPIVRNAYTGIKEVPKAAIEAGRGMGMSEGQILRRVELPLALPLILEGIRASAVLTIGIATVVFLIGAGGLGRFIQSGIDQVVPDLILLGAIPIILLALAVDGLLRTVGALLTSRGIR